VGLFRPFRRGFWFWWENRRRWKVLDGLCADPVIGEGITIAAGPEGIFLEMPDGRRFFWEPRVKNSLLGIPYGEGFEPNETGLLSSIIRDGDVVLDIGANFGWYTTLFSRLVGPAGRVHAFEPIPTTFERLRRNVRLNGSPANVLLNDCALGESRGTVTLHVPTRIWLGPAFASAAIQHEGPHASFDCGMETVDGYLARAGADRVDLIKCDVEGGELNVLRGARELFSSSRPPIWFLEIQDVSTVAFGYQPEEIFAFMRGCGYESYYQSGRGLLPAPLSGKLPVNNFLFLIPDLHRDRLGDFLK
jgi:FkbM family methyltransferase